MMKYVVMTMIVLFCIPICGCFENLETPPYSKQRIEKLKADKENKAEVSQTEEAGVSPFLILPI